MPAHQAAWRAWIFAGVLYTVAYFALAPQAQGWAFTGLSLASALTVIAGARLWRPARPLAWLLLGLGLFMHGAGNLVWYTNTLILDAAESIIGPAKLLYAASYSLVAAALLVWIRARSRWAFRTNVHDALIAVVGTGVLWWHSLIEPVVVKPGLNAFDRIAAAIYPTMDVVLLALLGLLLVGPGRRTISGRFVASGLAALLVADGFYYRASLTNSYEIGSATDAGWLIAFVCFGAAALHPSMRTRLDGGEEAEPKTGRARLVWFVGAALAGPVVLAIESARGLEVNTAVFAGSSLGLFLLVLMRMVGLLRDGERRMLALDAAGNELRASEERYRRVVASVKEVIFQADVGGKWTFLNPAWQTMAGFSVEESLGRYMYEFVHAEDRDALRDALSSLLVDETPMHLEIRYLTTEGEIRWCECYVTLLRADDGAVIGATGTLNDITDRREADRALADAERKYRALVEQIPAVPYSDGIDPLSTSLYISPRVKDLVGYTPEEWQSNPANWVNHLHPEDRDAVIAERERSHELAEPFAMEYRVIHRDGHVVWVRDEAVVMRAEDGVPPFWQGLVVDITEPKRLEEQLLHQAFHDSLTGLANRALFTDRVQHALSLGERGAGPPLAVLFIDLDDFKTINDSLGHEAGDQLLRAAAQRLDESLRSSDTAARLGGDEFGVLVEDIEGPQDAVRVAERIIETVGMPFSIHGREVVLRPSVGIAVSLKRRSTHTELLRNADLAMYKAKRMGKGGYALFEPEMHSVVLERMQLKADLESAIGDGQLELHYQPIIDLQTRAVVGTEALIRWNHPTRGLVPPLDFIPIAEETDQIIRIGDWVIREACAQAKRWQDARPQRLLSMTVNLSAVQLQRPGLVASVKDAVVDSGLDPSHLTLEITESALMTDVDGIVNVLRDLKSLGVRIAVDDFGTGYSSLGYLQRFPLDILKIDRSFIREVDKGPEHAVLAHAVIELAGALSLQAIAEGIETIKQSFALQALGCTHGQGYYFSPPRAASDVEAMLVVEDDLATHR